MLGLERLGNKRLDLELQRLRGRIAEHSCGPRVPEHDPLALRISDDHRVADSLEEPTNP
jgi:hypothetical protein